MRISRKFIVDQSKSGKSTGDIPKSLRMEMCHMFLVITLNDSIQEIASIRFNRIDMENKTKLCRYEDEVYAWRMACYFHLKHFFCFIKKYDTPIESKVLIDLCNDAGYYPHNKRYIFKAFQEACQNIKPYFDHYHAKSTKGTRS